MTTANPLGTETWIPHDGGPCPVAPHVRVRVRTRDGWVDGSPCPADFWISADLDSFVHEATPCKDDIIAYQIIED